MKNKTLLAKVPTDLLHQALETEKGGVQVYSTALRCACGELLLLNRRGAEERRGNAESNFKVEFSG